MDARGYVRKPRPGAAPTPFLVPEERPTEGPEPPRKRARPAGELADEFSSEQGKIKNGKG